MQQIFENTILEWRNEVMEVTSIERILWVSPKKDKVVLIRIDVENENPYIGDYDFLISSLEAVKVNIVKQDPYFYKVYPENDYLEKHKKIRDDAWEIIKDVVFEEPHIYYKKIRVEMLRDIKSNFGIGDKRLNNLLRRYWIGGKHINALLPNYDNCGGQGKKRQYKGKKLGRPSLKSKLHPEMAGVGVSLEDERLFRFAIKKYHINQKLNLMQTYNKMREELYIEGYKKKYGELTPILKKDEYTPTFRQFQFWYANNFNFKERMINRKGELEFELQHRMTIGNATGKAYGPGAVFEIDATMADVYLVSAIDRSRILGRPIVYIVKDVYSRMVVGLHVALEGPSWICAMMAIENATKNKKEYCKSLNIEIEDEDWPCFHIPRSFSADRGEMLSITSDRLTDTLGISIKNTPPYRGDLKSIVERHFRTLNEKIKEWIPGAVQLDHKKRTGKDYALDAVLTLKSFEEFLVYSILEHNNTIIKSYPLEREMMEENIIPTPLNIWNWGRVNRSSILRVAEENLVKFSLLPNKNATVTSDGISINKRNYSCEVAIKEGWFEKARKKRRKLNVVYDPRNLSQIHFTLGRNEIITANLIEDQINTSSFIKDIRLEDVIEQERYFSTQLSLKSTDQRQFKSDINNKVKSIINREKNKTNKSQNPFQSQSSKRRDIKQNRKEENDEIRLSQSWTNLDGNEILNSDELNNDLRYKEDFEENTDSPNPLLNLIMQIGE